MFAPPVQANPASHGPVTAKSPDVAQYEPGVHDAQSDIEVRPVWELNEPIGHPMGTTLPDGQ